MDPFDCAQEFEQKFREKALAYQLNRSPKDKSAEECDCGAVIPEARRLAVAGVKTCIDCQEVNEKQRKLYAK